MFACGRSKRTVLCGVLLCGVVTGVAQAATFTVSNTDDSGAGSLRQAILDANTTAGNDVIDITLSAGSVIAPLTALPNVDPVTATDTTTIQATNRITLSGENVAEAAVGLALFGNGCIVRGINIVNWTSWGISIDGSDYRVSNCYIGTDGTNALPNANGGILISNVDNGIIGRSDMVGAGNVISGNDGPGIRVSAASGASLVIGGNSIGTNAAGDAALPNLDDGILSFANNVRIGGSPIGERNLISGNTDAGISVSLGAEVVIRNNRIGVNAAGDAALPNGVNGINVGVNVTDLVIGGQLPALANVISGNTGAGILSSGNGVVIQGNRIGTNGAGTIFLPNSSGGVKVAAGNCTIGGLAEGAGNTIAGNTSHGIGEVGSTAQIVALGNSIYDNGASGIDLNPSNPFYTEPPVLTCLFPLSGTAAADSAVEVFTDASDEGRNYLDTVQTDEFGNWTSTLDLSASAGLRVTLTATRSDGGTSEFSSPVVIPETFEACVAEGEGAVEGVAEGEGIVEGEGVVEGVVDGEGTPEGEGIAEGVVEGEGEEEFPPLERCAAETLGGQRPMNLLHPNVGIYTSDDNGVISGETISEDLRFDNFSGVAGAIGGLRWWGVGVSPFFEDCDRAGGSFRIAFYADSPSSPGAEVVSFVVTPQRVDTGFLYSGRKIYRHQVVFPEPVELGAGWLSVAGTGDEECRFGWYRSDQGDSNHYRVTNSSSGGANGDFSFCFLPVGFEIPEGEGIAEGEGIVEGAAEGVVEGIVEGVTEGVTEGVVEGVVDGEGMLEGEGVVEGEGEGVVEGEGSTEEEYLENCPAGVTSSQPPAPVLSPNAGAYGSDVLLEDYRIERFSGMTEPIVTVRWWGVGIDVGTFAQCMRTDNQFIVRFYEGSLFTRGDLVSEQTVTASQESTGEQVSNRTIYRHRAELPVPVALSDGWLSIQGSGDTSCAFYWYRSDVGNGDHIRESESPITPSAAGDLSYCLVPAFAPLPGHSADQDGDEAVSLSELIRVVQLFNGGGLRCDGASEDGFAPVLQGALEDRDCPPHASDYAPRDWAISLSELLRLIQIYSVGQVVECESSEDGFCTSAS